MQHEQGPCHIDRKQPVVTGPRDVNDGGGIEQGGIVDQDVDATKLRRNCGYTGLNTGLIRNIDMHRNGHRANFGGGLLRRLQFDVSNRHPCAFGNIGLRERQPDPARSAGNKRGFSSKSGHAIRNPCASNRCSLVISGVR